MWMGIKLLLVLHITASAILYAVRPSNEAKRTGTALSITISGLSGRDHRYLRFLSLNDRIRSPPTNRAVWMDLSARGKIKLTGEDRARLLLRDDHHHIQQLRRAPAATRFPEVTRAVCSPTRMYYAAPILILLEWSPETHEPLSLTPGSLHHPPTM